MTVHDWVHLVVLTVACVIVWRNIDKHKYGEAAAYALAMICLSITLYD